MVRSVELAAVDLSLAGYTQGTARVFTRELVQRVRGLPEVESAALAAIIPLGGGGMGLGGLSVPGVQSPSGRRLLDVDWNVVTPGYFHAMKMTLAAGRDFTDADRDGAAPVVIVNETAARRWWPGQDPIGRTLIHSDGRPGDPNATRALTVIAVARDTKYRDLGEAPRPFVYVAEQQQYVPRLTIVARSRSGRRLAADLRTLVARLNPNLPIVQSQTLEDYAALTLIPQRVAASVSGSLGLVGLLLAAIGIYGVTAHMVTSRTREFGIRMALGAQRGAVMRMVLRQGLVLTIAGAAIGLVLAGATSRLLGSLLFGVGAADPVTFVGSAVLFCLVGLAACYTPARRATTIDASQALRHE
jgi:predicted permease